MDFARPRPGFSPSGPILAGARGPDRAGFRGRGAVANPTGRFEKFQRSAVDDGWLRAEDEADPAHENGGQVRTTVTPDASRKVIARNTSPDIPFDRSINVYRGCEHGCVYCYARPSHAYLGLSPGLDFETRLFAKHDAATLLADELRKPGYKPAPISLGSNTDCYQPVERRLAITRSVLGVLSDTNHPVTIVTKSDLVTRDIDLLADMATRRLVHVYISLTTLDPRLARAMEPRASTPAKRLSAIGRLAAAGIPTGVMTAPVIPALTDHEIESLLDAASAAGAETAGYVLLRLPHEIKDLFSEWLGVHAPNRAERVLSLVREARGGRLNDPRFGSRMRGDGPYAELIRRRHEAACRRFGLNRPDRHGDRRLDTSSFRPPSADTRQLALF